MTNVNIKGSGQNVKITLPSENGTSTPLGGIQKVSYEIDAQNLIPKCILDVYLMVDIDVKNIDADINVVLFGPNKKKIEDMTHEELVEALKYEAKYNYLHYHRAKLLEDNK